MCLTQHFVAVLHPLNSREEALPVSGYKLESRVSGGEADNNVLAGLVYNDWDCFGSNGRSSSYSCLADWLPGP